MRYYRDGIPGEDYRPGPCLPPLAMVEDADLARPVHYAGALRWKSGPGGRTTTSVLAGWAACCSGDRAEKVRSEGRNTYDPRDVTCKACLRCMAKAERS